MTKAEAETQVKKVVEAERKKKKREEVQMGISQRRGIKRMQEKVKQETRSWIIEEQ